MGKSSVVGAAKLQADLDRAAAKILAASDAAVDDGADAMAADMRAGVPVLTGATRDGIEVRDGEDGVGKDVGVYDVDHAAAVEFGTDDTPAQPFVQPAAESERQRFPRRVGDKVNGAFG